MFSLYPNRNSYANLNPNSAKSDSYIQAFRILAGSCSGISMVSRVRVKVKVTVTDQYVNGLTWYGCSTPTAE